jgi:hypothetical protein
MIGFQNFRIILFFFYNPLNSLQKVTILALLEIGRIQISYLSEQ